MADVIHTPTIRDGIGIGELPPFENQPADHVATYVEVTEPIDANSLGLYFQGHSGQGSQTQITATVRVIKVNEVIPLFNPKDFDGFLPSTVIAENINLSSLLTGSPGWKWLPIDTTTFQPGLLYVIIFDLTVTLPSSSGADTVDVAQTELMPSGPTDIDGITKRSQTDQWIVAIGGQSYDLPVAIGLQGTGIDPCPPGQHYEDGVCVIDDPEPEQPDIVIKEVIVSETEPGQDYTVEIDVENQGGEGQGFVRTINTFHDSTNMDTINLPPGQTDTITRTYLMEDVDQRIIIETGHFGQAGEILNDTRTVLVKAGKTGSGAVIAVILIGVGIAAAVAATQ